jgi:PAS domain S-box-containing protein
VLKSGKIVYTALILAFIMTMFSGCAKKHEKQSDAAIEKLSFRDIPGITQDEINAIEALQKKYGSFVYGMDASTEAFIGKDGGIHGYAPLFCDWLTKIFGIPFKIKFYEWGDLLKGLESGDVDFTGELMFTPERRKTYFMTSPTVDRSIKIYRIRGDAPLDDRLYLRRKVRYAFLKDSILNADVIENAGYKFETVFVDDYNTAYRMMKNGEVDAYFGMDTSDVVFQAFNDVTAEDFYPLIFKSSCLSTQEAELAPIINAVDKALDEQTLNYLSRLYEEGHQQYLEDKLYNQLTEEERAYIQNNPVIPVAAEFNNYPISFFDTNTDQWQGMYFDTLDEVTRLTGLKFEHINNQNLQNQDLTAMLEKGEVLILPELYRIKEYEGRFLWSEIPLLEDNFAFLSKSSFRNIGINQVPYLTVGIRKDSVYSEFFKKMFPHHRHLVEYDTQEEAWNALQQDEVEIIFACNRRLVTYTNFYEQAGYKLNLIIDHSFDLSFGYNKDAVILKSIVDKALRIININNIANQRMHKTYDYRYKLAQAQRPWLIGAAALFLLVLILVISLLIKSRSTGKQLEDLVAQRTSDLAFQTSKLEAVIDSIPDYLFCKDKDFRYTQCNKLYEDFLGIHEADILGKTDMEGAWLYPDHVKMIYSIEQAVINEARIHSVEERVNSPFTGKEGIFETVKAPIRQDGAVVGIVATIRDITQRKEMEEEALAASHAKTAFLANMSHELRTPLNVVIGLTDLILEDDMSDHVRDNLVKISNAGNTLLSIVNDILDFSKIESGKLILSPIEYYTPSMLNDVITLVITHLEEKPVIFHLDINDDLPNKLYGDDLRVKQVLTNLLTNAVKYTQQGSITLKVRCTRDGDSIWMDVAVIDTGMGIPKNDIKNLFLDYYQVVANSTRNIEGTGLGLPITKRLVEMMGGEMRLESEYGKGSTFGFRIKQGFIDDSVLGADVSEKLRTFCYSDEKRIVTRKLVRANLSYARVLVVDDMQTNLDVAAGILRKYQMQVDCVNNGQAAIDQINRGKPVYNAIFMDHMMPGMDGIETADRIRALNTEYAKKIPIIALTANAIQGTDRMFFEHDFQAFVTKPIDIMEMDAVLRKWVHDKNHEVHASDAPTPGLSEVSKEKQIVIEIPGVDTKKGLTLYAGETDIYIPLLHSYVANTPITLNKLRAVTRETLPDYVISVHGLKGTSAGIGAETIRAAAYELEMISRSGDLQGVLARNDKLIAGTETIVANVKAWIEQYDAKNAKPRLKAPDRGLLARLRQCCQNYDMSGIDEVMSELNKTDYEEDADLMTWIKEKIDISEIGEVAERLAGY